MMASGWTVVLDVGKTLAKATLWNEARESSRSGSVRTNARQWAATPTLDAAGIERGSRGL